ncbi:2254_t:CDS:2 [Paraglomus brasilianum]|uniref:2254_t:CDS:1 n=1 Tax=Paraglomus brasilianum TaxID=144538 RepID=A0A9N8VRY8_9GLOM|nr:2254_t:CDS:2 [Paraglomus brasilianum]
MANPWVLLSRDLKWIFVDHLRDFVVEFLLRNSIFAIRFDPVANPNEPTSELNLKYLPNWCSIIFLTVATILTLPIFVFYPLMMLKALDRESIRDPSGTLENAHPDEKWFFINGVLIDKQLLEQNCKYLEKRFGRGVTGIHNKSYGPFWDVIETFLQRSFNIETVSVRWAVSRIIPALKDEKVKTVRMVAHSQGGVIAGLVLTNLYIELSRSGKQDRLKKLEVYTFANAAREFVNPGRLVRRIEHYANEKDPIPMFGVLNNIGNVDFHGDIFVNRTLNNGKGHLFNTFYSFNEDDYVPVRPIDAVPTLLQMPGHGGNLPIRDAFFAVV